VPEQEPPHRWSRRSSKTSSKPPDGSPRAARSAAVARARRDREPRAAAVTADAHGRRRRHRDHDDAGLAVKIILGGASNSRDLQDLSTLIGERDEYTDSVTLGDRGTRSNQRSIRRVPILPPDRIRTLPFGTIVTDLRAWPNRPDATRLRHDRDELESLLRRPS